MSPDTLSSALDALVLRAQKPSRYVGGERGSVRKDLSTAGLRFALAFPDTYEVGMSNLGFRLLYHLLNDRPEIACERVFLPWPDLEGMLRAERLPLFTLESRAPVAAFDVLGVTLQFELAYTSVLAMLDLAGIPLLSRDRGDDHPLVLGGGPLRLQPGAGRRLLRRARGGRRRGGRPRDRRRGPGERLPPRRRHPRRAAPAPRPHPGRLRPVALRAALRPGDAHARRHRAAPARLREGGAARRART